MPPKNGDTYTVLIKPSHVEWGTYRNTNSRDPIQGESYVKIPADAARKFDIKRGDLFIAHFLNYPDIEIKASGNGPLFNGVQYAKQFEGVGIGACKAFTPWYILNNVQVNMNSVRVTFLGPDEVKFEVI